jgi:hypothetical protein
LVYWGWGKANLKLLMDFVWSLLETAKNGAVWIRNEEGIYNISLSWFDG